MKSEAEIRRALLVARFEREFDPDSYFRKDAGTRGWGRGIQSALQWILGEESLLTDEGIAGSEKKMIESGWKPDAQPPPESDQ